MWYEIVRPADRVLWKGSEDIPFTKATRNVQFRAYGITEGLSGGYLLKVRVDGKRGYQGTGLPDYNEEDRILELQRSGASS